MLHIRIISPQERSDAVVETLRDYVGVAHVVRIPGVAVEPAGDLIEADVTREAANELLKELRALELRTEGAITVELLDMVLSEAADRAEHDAPGDPEDAVVWDELLERTNEDSTLSGTFLAFLCLACLLAAVGVVTDSPVTVVGGMVVGPEFGPLGAIAVAIVRRRYALARRSVVALAVGFPLAMVVTGLGALAAQSLGWMTMRDVTTADQLDFIYQVGPFSLVVALLAGAAGMLSLVSSKSAALVGVFISVTTVPAAGYAAVAATLGQWRVAAESTAQLVINLIGIVVAGVAVLLIHRAHSRRRGKSALVRKSARSGDTQ
ncbi:DUF389 domain-containing protein [Williamsia muralis]|uniref:DUF389 domain-containing protein n=1 Tax=Williamsia marianensis TaxID=85044 RepID=UPI003F1406E4